MPQITIIVPIYKVEPYLHKCVDSILAQTFTDFELVLVDDGSPDNCGKICDEYARKDSRVKVIHQENGGLSAARNAGLDWVFANSGSEWIFFADSDDTIAPNCLETLYYDCVNNGCDIGIGGIDPGIGRIDFDGPDSKPQILKTDDLFKCEPYWKYPKVSVCGKLFKKELFADIRFPAGKINEDRFTIHKLLFQREKILCAPQALYFYEIRESSISHDGWSPKRMDDLEACEEQIEFFGEIGAHNAYVYTCNEYLIILSNYIIKIRKTGLPKYKEYYDYLKRLLKKNLKRFENDVPKDTGLLCYRIAFFDKKKPLTVIYYALYMLAIYGPKKTFLMIKNRENK